MPLPTSVFSFVKVLTLPSTRSCTGGPAEDCGRRASAETIPAMRPLVVVELQKAVERRLQRSAAREAVPAKRDTPMLVQDRLLQALHDPVGPRVPRFGPRHANAQAPAAKLHVGTYRSSDPAIVQPS